jgi:group I intron endonuclease
MTRNKKVGIYAIRHRPTGAAYVGGSITIVSRYTTHRMLLRRGTHHCPALQSRWSGTPESEWEFVILEECGRRELLKREQWWLDNYSGELLNLLRVAGSMKGYKFPAEFKVQHSERMRKIYESPALRTALSERAVRNRAHRNFGDPESAEFRTERSRAAKIRWHGDKHG